jgi:hypothetical protein
MAKWGFVGGNVRESEQCGGVVKEGFVFVFQRFKDYPSLSLSLSCKAFCVSEALPRWLCAILAYVFIEERDESEVTDILISIHLSLTMKD